MDEGIIMDTQPTTQLECTSNGGTWNNTDETLCADAGGAWAAVGTPSWTAFTLDIYMSNTAGCSYCSDNTYDNKDECELLGDYNSETGLGEGVWTFDTSKDEATCEASDINGFYFSGDVFGIQFFLGGEVDVAGLSGGTAAQYLDYLAFFPSSGKVLGLTFTGAGIPAGSGVLLTMRFSTTGEVSCFAPQSCTDEDEDPQTPLVCTNVISDADGSAVDTGWGDCYCVEDSDEGGGDGHCDSVDNCSQIANPDQADTDGDGAH
jgi:hypothetical protein